MLPSVLGVPAFSVVLFVNSTGEIMLCFYNLPCYVLLARLLQHTHHRPRFWGIHKWVHQYVTILNTAQHFSFKCSPVQHVWIDPTEYPDLYWPPPPLFFLFFPKVSCRGLHKASDVPALELSAGGGVQPGLSPHLLLVSSFFQLQSFLPQTWLLSSFKTITGLAAGSFVSLSGLILV